MGALSYSYPYSVNNPKIETAAVGGSMQVHNTNAANNKDISPDFTGNAVNDVFNVTREQLIEYIRKQTNEQLQEQLKLAESNLTNVDIHSARKAAIFRSRQLQQMQDLQHNANVIARTPLGNVIFQNPYVLAGAQQIQESIYKPDAIKLENLLDDIQAAETADAFFADGMIRSVFSKMVDFILPDYTKTAIYDDPIWLQSKAAISKEFPEAVKQTLELTPGQIAMYNFTMSKTMENLKLWDGQIKLLVSSMLMGRNALFVERDAEKKTIFKKLGKPTALFPLNPMSIKKAKIDNKTKRFDGFYYDWGTKDKTYDDIGRDKIIPFFYDDFPIYRNTYFSGMTRVFSLVGLAHSSQLINSYDMPEATKTQYSGTQFVYVGAESNALVDYFSKTIKPGINPHNKPMLRVDEANAAKEIISIIDARLSNYKAITMILGIPMFLMFEDAANFATAAIAMQSFINGTVHRLAKHFGDHMREYFFLPCLADIINKDIEEINDKLVQHVKAIMPTVTLETKTDRINNANAIWDRGGFTSWSQYFKYIGEDALAELSEPLDQAYDKLIEEGKKDDIDEITGNEAPASQMGRRLLTQFKPKTGASEQGVNNPTSTQTQTGD